MGMSEEWESILEPPTPPSEAPKGPMRARRETVGVRGAR
jgi:hypothetical protein